MSRLPVLKTYKLFIGGQFPRTESGRYYPLSNENGDLVANVCLASRKDFRNAVSAALVAGPGWASKTAFNRSQILYRIAEITEGRREQFIAECQSTGLGKADAVREVDSAIETLVHYAGWADKFQQLFSSVNPVSGSFFNFSVTEPVGLVAAISSENAPFSGLVGIISHIITGGNSCVVLASEKHPLSAISFAEVLATSDLPGGVVNILTGKSSELAEQFATHQEVKTIFYGRKNDKEWKFMAEKAANTVKRTIYSPEDSFDFWSSEKSRSPYLIKQFLEVKTTWHPIEQIGSSGVKY